MFIKWLSNKCLYIAVHSLKCYKWGEVLFQSLFYCMLFLAWCPTHLNLIHHQHKCDWANYHWPFPGSKRAQNVFCGASSHVPGQCGQWPSNSDGDLAGSDILFSLRVGADFLLPTVMNYDHWGYLQASLMCNIIIPPVCHLLVNDLPTGPNSFHGSDPVSVQLPCCVPNMISQCFCGVHPSLKIAWAESFT